MNDLFKLILEFMNSSWTLILEFINSSWTWILELINSSWTGVTTVYEQVLNWFQHEMLPNLLLALELLLLVLYDGFEKLLNDIIWLSHLISIEDIINFIKAIINNFLELIQESIQKIINWWRDASMRNIEKGFENITQRLFEGMVNGVKKIGDIVCSVFGYPGFMSGTVTYHGEKLDKFYNFLTFTIIYQLWWVHYAPYQHYRYDTIYVAPGQPQPFTNRMNWYFKQLSLTTQPKIYRNMWIILHGIWLLCGFFYLDLGPYWIICIKKFFFWIKNFF